MPNVGTSAGARLCSVWRTLLSAFLLSLSTLLSGCLEAPIPPLAVGMNPWVGYDALILAREKGLYDVHEIKVVELHSSAETMRQFRNGLLDVAAITLDEALRLADEGEDIRVVAVLDESAGADVVMASPRIRQLSDLKGQAIAVEDSTVGSLMLKRMLQAADLTENDIRVIKLEAVQHNSGLKLGRFAASVTYEPLAQRLRDDGYQGIFDSRQMPGEIVDVLVVRARVLKERPAPVRTLLRGWLRAQEVLASDPVGAARVLAPGVELTEMEYLSVRRGLIFFDGVEVLQLMSSHPPKMAQNAERLAATLLSMGVLRDSPDWGRLLDPVPLSDVLAGSPL